MCISVISEAYSQEIVSIFDIKWYLNDHFMCQLGFSKAEKAISGFYCVSHYIVCSFLKYAILLFQLVAMEIF